MTYWNPVERFGVERFAGELAAAGGAGLITPDLIPDEADEWIAAADAHGLDKVFLVAPSSTRARLEMTTAACRGFVYATRGHGGDRCTRADQRARPTLVARVEQVTDLPVGVGLGVSNGDQAAEVAAFADAVIVGQRVRPRDPAGRRPRRVAVSAVRDARRGPRGRRRRELDRPRLTLRQSMTRTWTRAAASLRRSP